MFTQAFFNKFSWTFRKRADRNIVFRAITITLAKGSNTIVSVDMDMLCSGGIFRKGEYISILTGQRSGRIMGESGDFGSASRTTETTPVP